jgi:hypothetical protein
VLHTLIPCLGTSCRIDDMLKINEGVLAGHQPATKMTNGEIESVHTNMRRTAGGELNYPILCR